MRALKPNNAPRTPVPPAELLGQPKHVGRLRTVADWHRQVGKIFREMRKGEMAKEDGTRLTYVAQIGAQLAKFTQELSELEALRQKLAELQQGQPYAAIDLDAPGDPL